MSLSSKIIGGLVLGIFLGLFFGERCGFLGVFGDAFIGLLQMTVLPYIVVSLIANIGRLSLERGRSMVLKASGVLALLLLLGMGTLLLAPLCFPEWEAGSFFSSSLIEEREPIDWIGLYIPANPFGSLANNIVPAVVLFCIFLGVAFIPISDKEEVLGMLDVTARALNRLNGLIIKLTPAGVLAIAASTAGTMTLEEIGRLQAYVLTYSAIVLVLGFCVLPALLMAFTPFRYRDILGVCRGTLITIFATGKIIIVLPQLIENVKELFRRYELDSEETDAAADVLMPLAYPFPNLGTLAIMVFVPFASWYLGRELTGVDVVTYLGAGLVSSFVAPVVGIPFVLDLVHVPADMFQLFVVSTVYTDRIRVVLGAIHLLVLTALTTAWLTGSLRFNRKRLLKGLALSALAGLSLTFLVRGLLTYTLEGAYHADTAFVEMQLARGAVPSTVFREEWPDPVSHAPGTSRIEEIRERGFLRVGYLRDRLPFAFMSTSGKMVGFDVEMAHALARDLEVRLEFVRIRAIDFEEVLRGGICDLVMSGVLMDAAKVRELTFSRSYLDQTLAFITQDAERKAFSSREALLQLKRPRIGVLRLESYWRAGLQSYIPNAEIIMVDTPRDYFARRFEEMDALLYSAEAGSAWTLLYPQFSVVVPKHDVVRVPMAYPLPPDEPDMAAFMDRWIELKQKDGSIEVAYQHWILGGGAAPAQPRWSIARDVLGWID